MDQVLITILGFYWAASAAGGGYVAVQKGREVHEGAIFGLLFGPLGMLVEAGLPDVQKPPG